MLVAALVAAGGLPTSAQRLIAELWPGKVPPTAANALQVHVSGLRKLVGARLRTVDDGYALTGPSDADEFEKLFTDGALDEALALWRGAAYEDAADGQLVTAAAARLEELLLTARQDWVDRATAEQRPVLAELSSWVAAEPTIEPLVERLMLALHRAGRSTDALKVYERTKLALAGYGTEPRAGLVALAEGIRRRDPTLDLPATGLPGARSRFIGRRAELDRAIDLLGTNRLLTVVGPGGCGKTRLMYEAAREMAAVHDAVHLVELAGHTTGLLAERVAAAVRVREEPGVPILLTLARHLSGRVLLLLDNCEHIRADVAAFAYELLAACPGVRIVATSREPLGLAGEVVFLLAGLTVPAPDEPGARSDAVRLLADRVATARGGLALQPAELPGAAELCRRLDGLPLAIELAAARLRAVPLAEIMSRLDRRLDLLVGTSPVHRHQTMRAAIDWGFDLLTEEQRRLLLQLSVFAGGFDPAAATAVRGSDALEPLTQLVDRSMVELVDGGYRLTETIREYAMERLDDDDPAHQRLVALCADRLAAPPPPDGPAHTRWLGAITREYDNIQAALAWSLDHGDAEQGLSIATAMWWYWWVTGRMMEGRAWLNRALAAATGGPSVLRGRALRVAASLARNSGDLPAARQLGEQCLAIFRGLDDRTGTIAALNNLSATAQGQRDHVASLAFGFEGLAMAEREDDARAIAVACNNTATTLRCLDRLDEAEPLLRRALNWFHTAGERRGEAAALTNLGIIARRRGDLDASGACMRSALRIYTELAIPEGQLDAIEGLAQLEILSDQPEAGLVLLTIAERERTALGSPIFTPDEMADRDAAEQAARQALTTDAVARAYRTASGTSLTAVVTRYDDQGPSA
ncbi:BTAD domain-containing putative transcriptional regulator [Actinoplanes nipponensis]|nr:BTAD domain-containing putative transcriptional regulator [Actinoplanes nipponensis]